MTGDWIDIGWVEQIPLRGSRTVTMADGDDIAVFRTGDGQVFALADRCPHKGGRLSQGIVHGHAVACPLHNWRIALASGQAQGSDSGCTPVIPVKVDAGRVLLGRAGMLEAGASLSLSPPGRGWPSVARSGEGQAGTGHPTAPLPTLSPEGRGL